MSKAPPKAPRPGIGRRLEEAADATQVMTITVRGDVFTLAVGLVPIQERMAVRAATGMPFEAFIGDQDKIGLDSIVVLWWLARRANGETLLPFTVAASEWPTDLDVLAGELLIELGPPAEGAIDPEA